MKHALLLLSLLALAPLLSARAADPATNATPAVVGRRPSDRNRDRSETIDASGRYKDPEVQSLCEAMRGLFRQIRDGLPEGWTMEETEDRSLGRSLLPEPSFFAAISPPGHMLGRWCFSRLEAAEQIPGTNRFERIDLLDSETWISSYSDILERNAETLVFSNRVSGFTITRKISSLNRGIVVLTNDYVAVHLMVFSPARDWADWDGFAQTVRETLERADWSAFEARRKEKHSPRGIVESAEAKTHAASAEGAFFLAALERAREIAARAGAECHVRTLYSATRGLEFKRGTQLAAQLTVPNPSADEDKTWLSKATATLYLGLVGTNGVDLADYDDEIRYGELRKKADANGIVSTGQGTQLCLRPTIRNKCLHWTDGTIYAILQYPVRFEAALFSDLWRETTNAVAGRALSAPPPADAPAARSDDLEEEGVRLLPVLTERFAGAGLERIWTCWFVSRAPLYDGSFLRLSSGQGLDNTKNREWWMRMTAHAAAQADSARDPAVADLFYGRTDGRPFVLEDYALANRGRTPKIRAWTDGDRFVVLRPYTPRDEDAVWDRFFEITTNVVRGPVFAP